MSDLHPVRGNEIIIQNSVLFIILVIVPLAIIVLSIILIVMGVTMIKKEKRFILTVR